MAGPVRAGKLRAAQDLVRKARKGDDDESLGSLLAAGSATRRPTSRSARCSAGLYAGDVDRLSVRATFPEIAAWEREHGSLTRGARAQAKAAAAQPAPRSGPARCSCGCAAGCAG